MTDTEILTRLGIALAIGLLIGLERGWHTREWEEGTRVAGLRTYGLIGLLGGIWALISQQVNILLLGFGFLGLTLIILTAYVIRVRAKHEIGITSAIAALLTFALGAMAILGYHLAAAAAAVIVTLLLDLKPQLHGWLRKLEPRELNASLELLLISVVLLPILPNQGYGPWQALNPYTIWWMVVLITGISFVGYFAMKIGGTRYGALLTGISGGLVSSTAVTLTLAKLTQHEPRHADAMASGILAACATMFPRILIIATVINPELFFPLLWPIVIIASLTYLAAWLFWHKAKPAVPGEPPALTNPFQIGMAIRFSILLAVILLLARAMQDWWGDTGLYLLSALSGTTDVDAISLSVSRMSLDSLSLQATVIAILIAAASNTMVKSAFALYIGGVGLGLRVGLASILALVAGGIPILYPL
ncbi:MAG TPA: MgtC/SapB family protein [Chromatiales bacterium]|nr:MgtC/SapB family protein [Chromatiales bacterium]